MKPRTLRNRIRNVSLPARMAIVALLLTACAGITYLALGDGPTDHSVLSTQFSDSDAGTAAVSKSERASSAIPAYPHFAQVASWETTGDDTAKIQLVQWQKPCVTCPQGCPAPTCGCQTGCGCDAPCAMCGVDCSDGLCGCGEATWQDSRMIPFQTHAQGEYVGPHRYAHVCQYRIRVDDQLEFVYRLTRAESGGAYRLEIGDQIRLESLTDEKLDRNLEVLPDGTITVRLLGQVKAAGRTVQDLTDDLENRYKKFYKVPAITVTPTAVNTKLQDLRDTVDARAGQGGQSRLATVTPEGTVQLPAIGSVPAQGLTLDELKREVDQRYACVVQGIEVTPVLVQRAPRFIYVLGEVAQPGRYQLEGPTTAMQAIALAQGWNNGGNLREIVIFRRGDDWRLMATRLDLRGALVGQRPCPADEIWLRDSDIVVVPKMPILLADDFIELVFTRGIYGVVPFQGINVNLQRLKTL